MDHVCACLGCVICNPNMLIDQQQAYYQNHMAQQYPDLSQLGRRQAAAQGQISSHAMAMQAAPPADSDEVKRLREELAQKTAEYQHVHEMLGVAMDERDAARAELQAAKARNWTLHAKLGDACGERDSLRAQVARLEKALDLAQKRRRR